MATKDLDQRCARKIMTVMPRSMRAIRKEMRAQRDELSVPQFRLLVCCKRAPATNRAAAEWLGITAPTASRMIGTLARKGLVVRAPSKDDAREIRIELTARGATRVKEMSERVVDSLIPRLRRLSPADRKLVARALEALALIFPQDEAIGDLP